MLFFFFQAEDGIRDKLVTGVQTCALPISIMAGHTLLGYVLAVGVRGAVRGGHWAAALRALVIWVLFLNGGTLAINSVFDRDEGDIGYLNAPPPLPRYLLHFSLGLLIAGQLLAFTLPAGFQIAYAVCFVLSILYSVPPF